MNWQNTVTHKLNILYPFIQAPMYGITSPEMVAMVSNEGSLGSLPLGLTKREDAVELIRSVKAKTGKVFSVNLFVYRKPEIEKIPAMSVLRTLYEKYDLSFPESAPSASQFPSYEDLIDLLVEEKIPVVSFTFGIPEGNIIERLKSNGCILIGTATSAEEAAMIEDSGIDIVVVQGIEAGGHRSSFIDKALPQTGLISLLPQVIDAVKIPVVAAGGLMQGRSIAAAFVLGANAVQLGSAFLRSHESVASGSYKSAVASSTDTSTVLTKAWTGKFARGIKNNFTVEMQNEEVLPYPYQNYYTGQLRKKGRELDSADIQAIFSGQSGRYARAENAGAIINDLIRDTEKVLSGLNEMF